MEQDGNDNRGRPVRPLNCRDPVYGTPVDPTTIQIYYAVARGQTGGTPKHLAPAAESCDDAHQVKPSPSGFFRVERPSDATVTLLPSKSIRAQDTANRLSHGPNPNLPLNPRIPRRSGVFWCPANRALVSHFTCFGVPFTCFGVPLYVFWCPVWAILHIEIAVIPTPLHSLLPYRGVGSGLGGRS